MVLLHWAGNSDRRRNQFRAGEKHIAIMDVSVNCGGNGPPRVMIRAAHGALIVIALFALGALPMVAQKKKTSKAKPAPAKQIDELTSVREEFIKATNDYKASLEKLLASYEKNTAKAETRLSQTRELFAQGLVSKNDVEASERTLAEANDKVAETRQRMNSADAQIADTLLEAEAEKSLSRSKPMAKVSLHPDGAEGQALLNFLRSNGIPFLAFRAAIPGTATGPHIHIGRPSHRY